MILIALPLLSLCFPLHPPPPAVRQIVQFLCLRFSCSAVHQLTLLQLTKPTVCGLIQPVPLSSHLQLPSGHQPLDLLQHPSLSLYLWLSSSKPPSLHHTRWSIRTRPHHHASLAYSCKSLNLFKTLGFWLQIHNNPSHFLSKALPANSCCNIRIHTSGTLNNNTFK